MQFDKNRRTLLKAATALGLSIGISASNITHAAVDMFLKIEGVDGEAKDDAHNKWIDVDAVVKGNKLILRNRKGKKRTAKQGTYRLSDGSVVVVKNGKIIKHTKGKRRLPAVRKIKRATGSP